MGKKATRSQSRSIQNSLALAFLLGVAAAWAYPRYQRDKRNILARLRSGSQMLTTTYGDVEYATAGKGQPILIVHGSGGGYDQGLLLRQVMNSDDYAVVSISRPGYRRTPLTSGKTMAEQADLYEAVLDKLGIERVIVITISAGGLAALQFAQRHPDRCQALVLISAVGPVTETIHAPAWIMPLFRAILSFDWLAWLLKQTNALSATAALGAMSPEVQTDASKIKLLNDVLDAFFPTSDWADGTLNDIEQLPHSGIVLEQIQPPTLVIHGTHDRHLPYATAQLHAEKIPNAELVLVENGTHFAIATHRDEIASAIENFIR
jgi:pimeloyl-ACP methyl ester carboxylesterase